MATSQQLQVLDLSGANIVSGGNSYYSNYGTNYYTANNEFGYSLFNGCKKIQKVVLPNSLVTIGQCAFWYCTNLETLVIGSKVTTIKPGLWGGCSKLTNVQINNNSNFHLTNGILYNKNYSIIIAALQTYNFGNLTIRSGVSEIQYDAFSFCDKLTSLVFPSSVKTIGDTAFEYTGITSVSFTSSITSIGSFAFSGCRSLKEVDLTSLKVTSLGYGVFMTSNIEIVYLPKTLTELKQAVFSSTPLKHIFAYTTTPSTMYDSSTNSPTFEGVDKESCVVHVPQGRVNTYKAAGGWKEFQYITDSQEIEALTDEAYAVYTTNETLTFYYDKQKSSRSGTKYELNTGTNAPKWLDNKGVKKVVFDSSFANTSPVSTAYWFRGLSNLNTIEGIHNLNTANVTDMQYMFCECSNLTSLDVSNFDTANVTNMSTMFFGCSTLTSLDVSNFDTSNVTKMNSMFSRCSNLTSLDVSNFDTSNVTNMFDMFSVCSTLTSLDVSNFNTSNVTNMFGMFAACKNLTSLDLSNFRTSNVSTMDNMFENCSSLTSLDVTHFDTNKVKYMAMMFYRCGSLTSLDVSHFDTNNVTNMSSMFSACSALTTIYASDKWDISKVSSSSDMFTGCTNLVGGAGTKYDANHVDVSYAHIDGGTSNPGYLTDINATSKEVCDVDEIELWYDNQSRVGNTGTEEEPAVIPACDEPSIDDDMDIDEGEIMIDGSDHDTGLVVYFCGGTINIKGNAGFAFKAVTLSSRDAAAASYRASSVSGGIKNSGRLTFVNSTLLAGSYLVENLAGGVMTLSGNAVAEGNGNLINSGSAYIDGTVSIAGMKNKKNGRVYINSGLTKDINITIDADDIEPGVPIILGSNGYTLSSEDASHIHFSLPPGYEKRYNTQDASISVSSTNGIADTMNKQPSIVESYDAAGRKLVKNFQSGISIQRMSNGKVRKSIK